MRVILPTAAMFLSHKAGSAASECVFRDTTEILTKFRLSTKDEAVETLTLFRSYLAQPSFNFSQFIRDFESFINDQESMKEIMLENDK